MMLHDINGVTLLHHQDQEDLLPKLMKPKENWNETSEAVNKVWTKEWWDVFEKSTKLFHCKTFWKQQKIINSFYKVETSVWEGTEKKWGTKIKSVFIRQLKYIHEMKGTIFVFIIGLNWIYLMSVVAPWLVFAQSLCRTSLKQQFKSG